MVATDLATETEAIERYRPPKRPRPANPRRRSTPAPGYGKPPLGTRLLNAATLSKRVFKYGTLPRDHVRLLRLRQGQPTDPIDVDLLNVPFATLGNDIAFEALSYNWGESDASEPIMIYDLSLTAPPHTNMRQLVELYQRRKMFVKYNLYQALYHLRFPDKDIWIWVDALCINQTKPEEKEVQVSRIADIYIAADNVLIWLGESDRRTKRAVRLLNDLADVDKQLLIIGDSERLSDWQDLMYLMKASWFSRRWVIQELALAKNAIVYCGADSIHWNDLRDGFNLFVEYQDLIRKQFSESRDYEFDYHALGDPDSLAAKVLVEQIGDVFRKNTNAGSGEFKATQSLESLTSSLFGFHCSDPRDTINALIIISREGVGNAYLVEGGGASTTRQSNTARQGVQRTTHLAHQSFAGKPPPLPSYQHDLLDVYVDFLRWIVDATGNINILCRHWALPERARSVVGYPELVTLPSWIKLTSDGRLGSSQYRHNGASLVGLPDKSPYTACGRQNKAAIEFTLYKASDTTTAGPLSTQPRRYASAKVRGLHLGTVVDRTDPMEGGNITKRALDMLGWKAGHEDKGDAELGDNIWRPLVAERGPYGNNPPDLWRKSATDILANYMAKGPINIDVIMPKIKLRHTVEFLKRMQRVTWNRRFIEVDLEAAFRKCVQCRHSPSGCDRRHIAVGLGPAQIRVDDLVCILYGCSVPCILRRRQSLGRSGEVLYDFIGEVYMYGFMDGEADTMLSDEERQGHEEDFTML